MTPPLDHACPSCGTALPASRVLVDAGVCRRECPSCRHVADVEVTAR